MSVNSSHYLIQSKDFSSRGHTHQIHFRTGGQFLQAYRKAMFIEFFETGHKKVFEGELGFKVFGGMSRIFSKVIRSPCK